MAKTKISEWSTTPSSNTDIDGINIAEGCAPSGINDAIRDMMAQIRSWQSGASADPFNGPMNGTIGATTAYSGAFTTLSATGAITSTLATGSAPLVIASTTKVANLNVDLLDGADWASPAAIGSTTPAAGSFTTLGASSTATLNTLSSSGATLTGGSINNMAIGGTTASTGAFTTLSASSTVTLSAGTANGVAYLNGSKAVTSGSALTFDGSIFTVQGSTNTSAIVRGGGSGQGSLNVNAASDAQTFRILTNGSTTFIDASAGMNFRNTTGDYVYSIGGSEQMRLTSTGLGIGTSSFTARLAVVAPKSTVQVTSSTGTNGTYQAFSNTGGNFYTGLDSSTGSDFAAAYAGVMWHGGAYPLLFGTSNVERMRLDSSGNLGLGVTPSAWNSSYKALQIGGSGISAWTTSGSGGNLYLSNNVYFDGTNRKYIANAVATEYEAGSVGHVWKIAPSGTAGNAISFTQAMTLTAAGNLGIGSTSPGSKLVVQVANSGTNITAAEFTNATNASFEFLLRTDVSTINAGGTGNLAFATGSTERGRFDSSGNLLVGTTALGVIGSTNGFRVDSGGTINTVGTATSYAARTATDGAVITFRRDTTTVGSISVTTSATAYNTSSDQRLKENIVDAESASALIDSLHVRQFDWKADGSHQRYGFVAQELVTVAPEAVNQPADPEEMMAVDYSKLVPMLVKEIQSLRKRLADAGI